jgi:hypothetical protein
MKQIIKGGLTFVPGVGRLLDRRGTGGTASSEYCYGVWLKHLTLLYEAGMKNIPVSVAEIGPGGSLGVGLAALLCGSNRCISLDVVEYADTSINLRVFEELVLYFEERKGRPTKGWPDYDTFLPESKFPSHILTDAMLSSSLNRERLEAIRNAITNVGETFNGISIEYHVPWNSPDVIKTDSIELVLSHSTMEHVEDLESAYSAMAEWCQPNSWCSHQIDYSSHGLTNEWDGYRKYSELIWRLIKGKRQYLINRAPHSEHIRLLNLYGFVEKAQWLNSTCTCLERSRLTPRWRDLTEQDRNSKGSFVVFQMRDNDR